MFTSRSLRTGIVSVLTAAIFAYPIGAKADGKMISTTDVIAELSHEQIQGNVQSFMARADVQKEMTRMGVDPVEASKRLAGMSDAELKQVAKQIEQQKAGADVLVIGLGTILIIVLIIFLIRRI